MKLLGNTAWEVNLDLYVYCFLMIIFYYKFFYIGLMTI